LVGLPVVYISFFSIGLYLLAKQMKNNLIVLIVFCLSIFMNQNNLITNLDFSKPSWEGNASVYRNQLEVIDYVYKEARGQNFKYNVYTPPVFDYTYRYLFKWYGPKKYAYSPTHTARIAYFIIEPDPGYPDRPKWWLEDRRNDGKIIKEDVLKGGIVVQTRIN
jgi:hypothetical protein